MCDINEPTLPKCLVKAFPCHEEITQSKMKRLFTRLSQVTKEHDGRYVLLHPSNTSNDMLKVLYAPQFACTKRTSAINLLKSLDIGSFILSSLLHNIYKHLSDCDVQNMLSDFMIKISKFLNKTNHLNDKDLTEAFQCFEQKLLNDVLICASEKCFDFKSTSNIINQFHTYIDWYLTIGIIPFDQDSILDMYEKTSDGLDDKICNILKEYPEGALGIAFYKALSETFQYDTLPQVCTFDDCALIMSLDSGEIKAIKLSTGQILKTKVLFRPHIDSNHTVLFTSPCASVEQTYSMCALVTDLYKTSVEHNSKPFKILIGNKINKEKDTEDNFVEFDKTFLEDILESINGNDLDQIQSLRSLIQYKLALKSRNENDIINLTSGLIAGDHLSTFKGNTDPGKVISAINNDDPRIATIGEFDNPLASTFKDFNIKFTEAMDSCNMERSGNFKEGNSLRAHLVSVTQQLIRQKHTTENLKKALNSTLKEFIANLKQVKMYENDHDVLQKKLQTLENHYHTITPTKKFPNISKMRSNLYNTLPYNKTEIPDTKRGCVLDMSNLPSNSIINQSTINSNVPDIKYMSQLYSDQWDEMLKNCFYFVPVRTYSNEVLINIASTNTINTIIQPFFEILSMTRGLNFNSVIYTDKELLPCNTDPYILNKSIFSRHLCSTILSFLRSHYLATQDEVPEDKKEIQTRYNLFENIDGISKSFI